MDVLSKIIKSVEDFPTLPTVYTALSDVMSNPNSTSNDAANVIMRDQASSAKILRTANSPLYGFRGRIDSISQAIFYIGFEEVKNLVIALSVIDMFKSTKTSTNMNPVDFWKHSIAVGVITKLIGKSLGVKNLENYFLSGILHDIGKLLFLKYLTKDYEDAVNYAAEKKVTIKDAESAIFGVTHTIAGELIAEKWKLPAPIRNAIKYHHTGVVDNEIRFLPASVHLADITARLLKLGNSGDEFIPEPNFSVWSVFKLPDDFFTDMYPKIMIDYHASIGLFLLN